MLKKNDQINFFYLDAEVAFFNVNKKYFIIILVAT